MKNNAGFRGTIIVLALVLLVQVPLAWAQGGQQDALGASVSASPNAPAITVWYGDTQNFGVLGNPQKQINILGNAIRTDELYYSLNGGPDEPLSMGTGGGPTPPPLSYEALALDPHGFAGLSAGGNKRLVGKGDFDVEIFTDVLREGANTVEIKGIGSGETTKTVTVNYTKGNSWPLPYKVDWSDYTDITEVVQEKTQIIDGKWVIDDGWLRPEVIGYDRTVAVGDVQWKDFDVKVLVHLKEFPLDNVGNVGILTRWQGHTERDAGEQPYTAWWDSGVFAIFRHRNPLDPEDCGRRLEMFYGHTSKVVDVDCDPIIKRNKPYYMRLRVQTKETAPYGYYSFKVWESDEPEPDGWVLEVADEEPEWLASGSVLLVAHESRVNFGSVEILPIVKVEVSTVGPGSVDISPELTSMSDAYLYGDTIQLTAVPDDPENFAFAGWSGDLTGGENPTSLTLEKEEIQITATFAPKRTLTVGIDPAAAGQVQQDPSGGVYGNGTVVTLTPKPNPNWAFNQWSGPNQSDLVNLGNGSWSIMMDSDKSVTASFIPGYALDITTTGQGTVVTDPPGLGFPAGTTVTLTAKPDWGWFFAGWQGDMSGRQNPASLTMDGNKAVEAVFVEANQAFLPLIVKRSR